MNILSLKLKEHNVKLYRIFLPVILAVLPLITLSQSVPFRVGNKFGIADLNGKMLVPATFDFVELPYLSNDYFVGYNFNDSNTTSTLIYRNKVILRDQPFRAYDFENGLFIGRIYVVNPKAKWRKVGFTEIRRIYDTQGVPVLEGDFENIAVIDRIDPENKLNEVLIKVRKDKKHHSLIIYDKKQKQITRTIVSNATDLEFSQLFNSDYKGLEKTAIFTYRDSSGVWKKLIVASGTDVVKTETTQLDPNWNVDNYDIRDPYIAPPYPELSKDNTIEQPGMNLRYVKVDLDYYYAPRKMERIAVTGQGFQGGYWKVFSSGVKRGLQKSGTGTVIIPAKYDEIIDAEFEGQAQGFILRNGGKYGLFIEGSPVAKIIEPVFNYYPLVQHPDFFGKAQPLIKLYDLKGNFFCYANMSGKLFYSEK